MLSSAKLCLALKDATTTEIQNMKLIKIMLVCCMAALSSCASVPKADIAALVSEANKGNAIAQNDLGSRYQLGDGVRKDYDKSLEWYRKASDQGLALATTNLGYMYDLGLGVEENNAKAIELYKKSADRGEPRAMTNLGLMYGEGQGIKQDYVQAYKWLDLARFYSQNSKDKQAKWAARGALDKLETFMTVEQIEAGKAMSSKWIKSR